MNNESHSTSFPQRVSRINRRLDKVRHPTIVPASTWSCRMALRLYDLRIYPIIQVRVELILDK